MSRLAPEVYEAHLKGALVCFRCGETAKNMPTLKKHLQDEFDTLVKRQVTKSKKRKRGSDMERRYTNREDQMVEGEDGSTNT
jgi:aprataxin